MKKRSAIEELLEIALKYPAAGVVLSVIFAALGLYLTNKQAPVGANPSEILVLPMMHMFGRISYFISVLVLIVAGVGFVVAFIKRKKPIGETRTYKYMPASSKNPKESAASTNSAPRFKTKEEYSKWKESRMKTSADKDIALAAQQDGPDEIIDPSDQTDASAQGQKESPIIKREESDWTLNSICDALGRIDWYQFEKFCAALLHSEGYTVERKGGAHPDGGIDLVATKDDNKILVQCKHWQTWSIKPKTVREMIGTMKINNAVEGAIYTLKGATPQAEQLANEQKVVIVEGRQLANRALIQLANEELDDILKTDIHHCPKCEAPMIWREGTFKPFWGCSRYPRCPGKLEHKGAR